MRAPFVAVAVGVAVLAAGCGGSKRSATTTTTTRAASPFADPGTPLRVADRGKIASTHGITIRDVSFAGRNQRVQAYLVLPARKAPAPAVILLHGSGGTRNDFLASAVKYAQRGAVAMTITSPSDAAPPPPSTLSPLGRLRRESSLTADDVVAVRRAVDYLDTQPRVDGNRIGIVGWSEGARTGAVVAGVEPRVKALVLMSGGALPVSAYAAAAPKALRPAVTKTLTAIDPLRWISRARAGELFLQDGRKDDVVPQEALLSLAQAAPRGSRLQWYVAGHPLNAAAVRDQMTWLSQRLGIGS